MKKKLAAFLVLLICGTFFAACSKGDKEGADEITNAGKDTEAEAEYWLCGTGIPDGPDYTGGICKVYFKENTIALEGNLLKSMTQKEYGEQIGTVETYNGEEIEVSSDCQIIQDEGNNEKTYAYREYIETREISETENVAGIYMEITVKNGKVIEIYYSS